MAEEVKEANSVVEGSEGVESKDFNDLADEFFDKREQETPQDSSPESKPQDEDTETPKDSEDPDLAKKGESEEKEPEVPKEFHEHPAWKRIMQDRDDAKAKVAELEGKSALSEEDQGRLAELREVTNSEEYIRLSMKKQGFTDEAIANKLREKGFQIQESPSDDVDLVARSLNVDRSTLNQKQIDSIADVSKVARVVFNDMIAKTLPNQLAPLQEQYQKVQQEQNAEKVISTLENLTKQEEVLNFAKDVEPELDKFLKEYPDATQPDILAYGRDLIPKLTIARLKAGGKQQERDSVKGRNRPLRQGGADGAAPSKTGDFNEDADAILDFMGVRD